MTAQDLEISVVDDPETVGARGAVKLLLNEVLAPAHIDGIGASELNASARAAVACSIAPVRKPHPHVWSD